ncbi:ABC transporter ATP-binding protein [Thermoleophilum album]|uniref:Heme exporter protein A n=1 Tax=Thermoleophilum album TaxID=29539 RepID=A0A1H6FN86_THEAL|nr:ATP-binding cassette domain-containing protein [Thermoleophilum album]SEH11313.1 heme exporter protein A [Thermoleophilum album]
MSAPQAAAIELDGVGRRFGEVVALRDVTLCVAPGETLCVVGANGAGKTTLARIVAGLLRASEGHVRVLGAALPDERHKLRGRIGYVGHDAPLYRRLSARENARFRARLLGLPNERVEALLSAAALDAVADRPVRELSRGLRQRAAIACALLADPELLVLDEPFHGLDVRAERLAGELLAAAGRTRVLVTHDLALAAREADHVLVLAAGRPRLLRREHVDAAALEEALA